MLNGPEFNVTTNHLIAFQISSRSLQLSCDLRRWRSSSSEKEENRHNDANDECNPRYLGGCAGNAGKPQHPCNDCDN